MTVVINGDTGISGVNGSAATPAIQGGDADTGIFFGTNTASISTGGSQRLFVDASGNCGIGVSSPSAKLDISTTARVAIFTGNGIEVNNPAGSNVFIGTQSGTEGKMGTVNNAAMALFANNDYSNRAELRTSGNFALLNGDLVVASGHGIDFSGTGDGLSTQTSELFHDYEEGTWTPTFLNGTSEDIVGAHYTKIGRKVFAYLYVDDIVTPNNSLPYRIEGLPYVAHGSGYYPTGQIGYAHNAVFDIWRPLVQQNTDEIYFHRVDGSSSTAINSDALSVTQLLISICYEAQV